MNEYKDYNWKNETTDAHRYLLPVLLNLLKTHHDKKILDIGCGSGYLTNELIRVGFDAYGIDASPTGIALAKKSAPDRFFLVDPSLNQLPSALEGHSFEVIISTEMIEHLYDPDQFIHFCQSILPPNGVLILSTPYHGYFKNLILALTGQMDKHFTALWRGGHIKFWSHKSIKALLTRGGFLPIGFFGCGRAPYLWKSMFLTAKRI